MSAPIDKFARLSALRPAAATRPAARGIQSQPRIVEQLDGAELCRNALGQHVVVRRRYPEPRTRNLGRRALELLLPGIGRERSDPKDWLFLDTETTGLAGGTGTYAFLVGLGWWEDDCFATEQLFMQDHSEEASLLLGLSQRLAEKGALVTFNGKSFDWPLLETRYRITRAAPVPVAAAHLDLLHPARTIWRYRLRSVALAELERSVLGIERKGDIPSSLIPSLYFHFLRGGPAEPLIPVFHHNRFDLQGLAALMLRMVEILDDPGRACCDGIEVFGVSRILQRRGDCSSAGSGYAAALGKGLPQEAEHAALRELAWMAKRRGDFEQANTLWEQLRAGTHSALLASEQLAIHYEHRARDPGRALTLVRDALVQLRQEERAGRLTRQSYYHWHRRLHHRLRRLAEKSGSGER